MLIGGVGACAGRRCGRGASEASLPDDVASRGVGVIVRTFLASPRSLRPRSELLGESEAPVSSFGALSRSGVRPPAVVEVRRVPADIELPDGGDQTVAGATEEESG